MTVQQHLEADEEKEKKGGENITTTRGPSEPSNPSQAVFEI